MTERHALSRIFRANLTEDASARVTDDPAHMDLLLGELLRTAREAVPDVSVAAPAFVSYLARHFPIKGTSVDDLRSLRLGDLYLACACAEGDPAAIALFESRYLADIGAALPRRDKVSHAEVKQALRERLFVPTAAAPPKIVEYSGRGDLASWVRVVAVRTALNLLRTTKREVPLDEDAILAQEANAGNAEIQHLKHLYRAEFQQDFREAFGTLSARDRNMLRQHYVDGLSMEQIAGIYRVHRITIVRRMNQARAHLAAETRRRLVTRLRLDRGELESIIRLIRSQLDLSLRAHLCDDGKVKKEA